VFHHQDVILAQGARSASQAWAGLRVAPETFSSNSFSHPGRGEALALAVEVFDPCRSTNGATPCSSGFPRDDLVAAMAEVDAIARPRDAKPYAGASLPDGAGRAACSSTLPPGWKWIAAPDGKAVQEANPLPREKLPTGPRPKMRDAPAAAIPKAWQPHVLDVDGRVNRSQGLCVCHHRRGGVPP